MNIHKINKAAQLVLDWYGYLWVINRNVGFILLTKLDYECEILIGFVLLTPFALRQHNHYEIPFHDLTITNEQTGDMVKSR